MLERNGEGMVIITRGFSAGGDRGDRELVHCIDRRSEQTPNTSEPSERAHRRFRRSPDGRMKLADSRSGPALLTHINCLCHPRVSTARKYLPMPWHSQPSILPRHSTKPATGPSIFPSGLTLSILPFLSALPPTQLSPGTCGPGRHNTTDYLIC